MNTTAPASSAAVAPAARDNLSAVIAVSREAGRADANRPDVYTIEGRQCLVSPAGVITPLVLPDRHLEAPRRIAARASFYECASFCAYINAHRRPGFTTLFGVATETSAGFSAVIDYHGAAAAGAAVPAWCEHVAGLTMQITPEWARWMNKNAQFMPQQAFAEHIEDNLLDIIDPSPAELLEVAQGLSGMKNVSFKSGRNLRDGAIKLEYVEQIEISGSTTRRDSTTRVPATFRLGIVPYIGAAGVEIEARLRFRIGNDGSLSFAYVLNRPYKVIETAFAVTREEIEKATALPVHLGTVTGLPSTK